MQAQKGARAIFQVAPMQMASFFGFGFEASKQFNPYQVYELYISTVKLPEGVQSYTNLEKIGHPEAEKVCTGFIEYLVNNDYGRYVEPEEYNSSPLVGNLFFVHDLIPTGADLREFLIKVAATPELYIEQFEAEMISTAFHTREFVEAAITRDLFFAGLAARKDMTREQLVKTMNAVERSLMQDRTDRLIAAHGFAVHHVEADGDVAQFIYTTGLVNTVGYELFISAAQPFNALSHVILLLAQSTTPLEVGVVDVGLARPDETLVRAQLVEWENPDYEKVICITRAEKPRVLQIQLADGNNHLPGEFAYDTDFQQPIYGSLK